MASSPSVKLIVTLVMIMFSMKSSSAAHHLSTVFYCSRCSKVFSIVKKQVKLAVSKEKRTGASLLRLHFHDCFVQGCDGSVLLDDTPTFRGEKTAHPNNNSLRGYEVIDKIKAKVEKVCPGVVSCADIVAIAARDSVVALGGPSWDVKLGRRDSRTANFSGADGGLLPAPTSTLQELINLFGDVGLSVKDMVALSGAHTIGKAKCTSFRDRIYEDSNIETSFARQRKANCPLEPGNGDNRLAPLDRKTPKAFDTNYFKNLIAKKGLLHSDQELYNGGSTDSLVETYSKHKNTFYSDFVAAMIRMGDISPLTRPKGEIRKHCRRVN